MRISLDFEISSYSQDVIGSAIIRPELNGVAMQPIVIEKSRLRRFLMSYVVNELWPILINPSLDTLCAPAKRP
ncbi:MAG TPA: hypothetical protein VGL83_08030 [Stellaceae bacterium]|jgi:hypothetical protein